MILMVIFYSSICFIELIKEVVEKRDNARLAKHSIIKEHNY